MARVTWLLHGTTGIHGPRSRPRHSNDKQKNGILIFCSQRLIIRANGVKQRPASSQTVSNGAVIPGDSARHLGFFQ